MLLIRAGDQKKKKKKTANDKVLITQKLFTHLFVCSLSISVSVFL